MPVPSRSRQLRKQSSHAEKLLWRLLRSRRLSGYKFRRQHPFDIYFLDFYCIEARVVVETDGSQHGFPEQQEHDQKRTEYLTAQGIVVKRIWNSHLRKTREREAFLENLWRLLQQRAPHPENRPVSPRRREPDNVPQKAPSP
jgi:very-short-patch-repair endonuclease